MRFRFGSSLPKDKQKNLLKKEKKNQNENSN